MIRTDSSTPGVLRLQWANLTMMTVGLHLGRAQVSRVRAGLVRRCGRLLVRLGDRVADRTLTPGRLKRLRIVPSLPPRFRRRYAAVRGPWPAFNRPIPADLLTVPGIRRDAAEEESAFAREPLHSFHHNYPTSVMFGLTRLWQSVIPVAPRLMRSIAHSQAVNSRATSSYPDTSPDPFVLTDRVRREAAHLGLSAIGIAAYDVRYTFVEHRDEVVGESVIVCVLEQNWPATQSLPGPLGEQTALSTNAEITEMTSDLATWLQDQGFEAHAHTTEGSAVIHHYAVQAGIGQLGFNGQLLTPQAGSRCRLSMVSTTAPLVADVPRDFGIPKICEACRACVRRCPSGAIPSKPTLFRGVHKTKLRLERCFPVVAQVNGCSVCMKVCPVQRYGLDSVLDHYEQHDGAIIGVGSDELEGYDWPLDGRHYAPGQRPYLEPSFFDVPGFGTMEVGAEEHQVTSNPLM